MSSSSPLSLNFGIRDTAKYNVQESLILKLEPKLSESKHALISDILRRKSFKAHEIAAAAGTTVRSIRSIKSNIQQYRSTKAPSNVGGRP